MTSTPERVSSASPYEGSIGFCRAHRRGPFISVSGTAPIGPAGSMVGAGDPHAQALRCFQIVEEALEELGASLEDVVRTRMYLVRRQDWQEVGAAHGAFFREVRPASTMVVVAGLLDPEWLVEVEADAIVGGAG